MRMGVEGYICDSSYVCILSYSMISFKIFHYKLYNICIYIYMKKSYHSLRSIQKKRNTHV